MKNVEIKSNRAWREQAHAAEILCGKYAKLLRIVAYPMRGTSEEFLSLQNIADTIQINFSLAELEKAIELSEYLLHNN